MMFSASFVWDQFRRARDANYTDLIFLGKVWNRTINIIFLSAFGMGRRPPAFAGIWNEFLDHKSATFLHSEEWTTFFDTEELELRLENFRSQVLLQIGYIFSRFIRSWKIFLGWEMKDSLVQPLNRDIWCNLQFLTRWLQFKKQMHQKSIYESRNEHFGIMTIFLSLSRSDLLARKAAYWPCAFESRR